MVSSVVPQLVHEYERVSDRYLGGMLQVVGPGLRSGIPIRTENPHEVGADRLVNAVAAYDRIGSACIVVDFGTAITYDVVSTEGELLGAVISPGVEISMEALSERAARLPKVELVAPKELIGRSDRDLDPARASSTASPARSTASSAACARSSGSRRPRSPPAAWPPRSRRSARRSMRSMSC